MFDIKCFGTIVSVLKRDGVKGGTGNKQKDEENISGWKEYLSQENSCIGSRFEEWLAKYPNKCK